MRVLIVNQNVGTPRSPGGTRHFSLGRELVRRGHDVTIAATSFKHMTRGETLAPGEDHRVELIDGVRFLWLRTPPYAGNTAARLWNMLIFALRVGRLGGKLPAPDVVIGSTPHLWAAAAARRLARRFGAPFVLEVRDLWPQTLVDLGKISPHHPLILWMRAIERRLYRSADRIISLLPGAVDHMAAAGADPERVVWLPNGVDLLQANVGPPPNREQFTVMYAGTHGLSNQLDTVLDAAHILVEQRRAGQIRFRLLGDGPAKPALMERARREGLTDFVAFEPVVPKAAIFRVLQEADAFVMTTQHSPLYRWGISPNKLFDYLASGRPVIVGCNSPYEPVTEAGAGFTIPPADPAAMAAAIMRLADMEPETRAAMGRRGRAYVERHHDFVRLGARLEQLLLDSLARAGTPVSAEVN